MSPQPDERRTAEDFFSILDRRAGILPEAESDGVLETESAADPEWVDAMVERTGLASELRRIISRSAPWWTRWGLKVALAIVGALLMAMTLSHWLNWVDAKLEFERAASIVMDENYIDKSRAVAAFSLNKGLKDGIVACSAHLGKPGTDAVARFALQRLRAMLQKPEKLRILPLDGVPMTYSEIVKAIREGDLASFDLAVAAWHGALARIHAIRGLSASLPAFLKQRRQQVTEILQRSSGQPK